MAFISRIDPRAKIKCKVDVWRKWFECVYLFFTIRLNMHLNIDFIPRENCSKWDGDVNKIIFALWHVSDAAQSEREKNLVLWNFFMFSPPPRRSRVLEVSQIESAKKINVFRYFNDWCHFSREEKSGISSFSIMMQRRIIKIFASVRHLTKKQQHKNEAYFSLELITIISSF